MLCIQHFTVSAIGLSSVEIETYTNMSVSIENHFQYDIIKIGKWEEGYFKEDENEKEITYFTC